MKRKRITQIFPFLLPLRRAQKKLCFYTKMFFDRNRYARTKAKEMLPNCIYEAKTQLFNENTGFDMKYQENKVFNLRLASEPVNGILIRPGETFSFWQLVRFAEKNGRYKEGLALQDGKLVTVAGGGLCHLSRFQCVDRNLTWKRNKSSLSPCCIRMYLKSDIHFPKKSKY